MLAQGLAALLFGAVHLGRAGFPKRSYAATAALGWFCRRGYVKSGSVIAAMITCGLAAAGQELFLAEPRMCPANAACPSAIDHGS